MRRTVLTAAGLLLCSGAVVLLCYSIYTLGRTGSCASGGVYVSTRPCPAGTGLAIAGIPGAVIAGLLGIFLYSGGTPSDKESSGPGQIALLMWSMLFIGIAGSLAFAAWGPAANENDEGVTSAAVVLLVVFIPMGLAPLLLLRKPRAERRRRHKRADFPPPDSPDDDVVTRLERLQRLRSTGAIDRAEFKRLKEDILRDSGA